MRLSTCLGDVSFTVHGFYDGVVGVVTAGGHVVAHVLTAVDRRLHKDAFKCLFGTK